MDDARHEVVEKFGELVLYQMQLKLSEARVENEVRGVRVLHEPKLPRSF